MLREQANVTVLMASVTDVDAEARQIVLDRGERIDYDSLIVACGGETSYFGHDEWHEVTSGLKTLADAVDLRDRVFGAFEEAERAAEAADARRVADFVVVGGGPTGVEMSGQLAILAATRCSGTSAASTHAGADHPAGRRRAGARRVQRAHLRRGGPGAWRALACRCATRTGHRDRRTRSRRSLRSAGESSGSPPAP